MDTTLSLTQRSAWKALQEHYQDIKDMHLRTLFAQDGSRGERPSCEINGLYLVLQETRHQRMMTTGLS